MKKIITVITMLMMLMALTAVTSAAATSSTSAKTSITIDAPDKVTKGSEFDVVVTFDGKDIGRVDGQLKYDSSAISYISGGTSSGDNGYVELKDAATGEALRFNLKFKSVNGAGYKLSVTTNGVYNLEEEYIDAPQNSIVVQGETVSNSSDETEMNATDTNGTLSPEDTDKSSQKSFVPVLIAALLAVLILVIVVATCIKRSNKKGRHSKYK